MESKKMWIGGKWVTAKSGKTYTAVNPATEEEIAEIPLGGKADVDIAVESARKAFPIWSRKPQAERSQILKQIAVSMREHLQELIDIDILDHATPVIFANMIGQMVPHLFEEAAELGKSVIGNGETKLANPNSLSYLQREPVGVCACIIPWNVPLMGVGKVASALAVGNTCIVKPPSIDSLPFIKIAEILQKHDLPTGAVNIVTGPGGIVGEAITSNPGVDMVSFTGSCDTGKAIMASSSKTVKRLILELGGKNPFIVLEDADVDAAIEKAMFASYFFSGMICGSPGRYYVHEKVYDEFVDKFVAGSKKVVVGVPNNKDTFMGPVVSSEHRERVEGYIKTGIKEGAKLLLGGKRPTTPPLDKGYYIMPAVFCDVTQNMTIAREEIFGPVACIMKFSSEDEVINLANDNRFGLAASVWTKNIGKGRKFASEIQAGTVWINDHLGGIGEAPWGGFKESGFGKDNDTMGQEEYTQVKVVSINTACEK
jgi:acyl-CoA reductase-like NAD-dependent aldehyde dehydrogenase